MKEHLRDKHKWDDTAARKAHLNLGLNMPRTILPSNLRKSKIVKREVRYKCPYQYCGAEVLRPGNHLRQFHKLKGSELKKRMADAVPIGKNTFAADHYNDDDDDDLLNQDEGETPDNAPAEAMDEVKYDDISDIQRR